MTEQEKKQAALDLIKEANKEIMDEVKSMKEENATLKAEVDALKAAPVKNAEVLKGSGIIVGKPSLYKGMNFKVQGTEAPELMPANEKERDEVVKELIDVFAPYSKNPLIRKAAMQEGTAGEGLEYVPEQWFSTVIEKARLTSVALRDARRFPMAGNILHIPVQGTSVSMTYAAEENASTESEPGSADLDITAGRFGLWGKISQELLDDSMIDLVSYITRDAVEELGQTVDDEVFNGTSAPFTALIGAGSTDVTFGSSNTATSYTDMVSRNFFDAIYSLASIRTSGAKWYLNRTLMPYIMDLKFGASDSALMSVNPQMIAGFPFELVEVITGTDATSSDFMSFGNMQHYALGVRSMSQAIEVNPYSGDEFKKYQVLFRFYVRMAGAPIFADHFINLKTA